MFSSKRHKITNEGRGWPLIKSQGLCGLGVQVKIHLWHLGDDLAVHQCQMYACANRGCLREDVPPQIRENFVFLKLESWNFSLWTWPTQFLYFRRNICEKFARIIKNQSFLAKIYWFWLNFVKDNVRICWTLYSIWGDDYISCHPPPPPVKYWGNILAPSSGIYTWRGTIREQCWLQLMYSVFDL